MWLCSTNCCYYNSENGVCQPVFAPFYNFVKPEQTVYSEFVQFGGIMFKKNFEKICASKNVAPTYVCSAIGLSNAVYSKWTDSSVPRKTTLIKLSNYLGVTVEDLLADDPVQIQEKPVEETDELDDDMKIIADLVSKIDPDRLSAALEITQKINAFNDDEINALLTIVRSMGGK